MKKYEVEMDFELDISEMVKKYILSGLCSF